MVFAVAHVRGGGELGRPWYEHGKLLEKKNTFTDFVACAEHLIAEGITVALGSDAAAPDRGYDMFRHMAFCMHYHRRHFRDPIWIEGLTRSQTNSLFRLPDAGWIAAACLRISAAIFSADSPSALARLKCSRARA